MEKNLLTIGLVARKLGISVEVIRWYELKGIVKPIRDSSGRRLFVHKDLEKINAYRRLPKKRHLL